MNQLLAKKDTLLAEIGEMTKADSTATNEEITAKMAEIDNIKAKIEAQKILNKMEDDRLAAEAAAKVPDVPPVYATPKNPNENKFSSLGEMAMAVYRASAPGGSVDNRLRVNASASGMSETVPSDGGFLVEQEMAQTIFERAYSTGAILQRCSSIPIGPGRNGTKIPAVDETSRATGSRWGGIRAYWEGEADQITGSKPKLSTIDMILKKLTALVYATDDLLDDAVALESFLMQRVPLEINFRTEDALVNGSGAGQPLGILNSNSLVTVAKETGQAADTIVFENVSKIWSRCWAPSRQNAVWLINQDCEPQLDGMAVSVGTGGVPVYLPPGGLSQSPYATLKGRPVIPVEYCPTLGDVGDIILADFSQYQVINKGDIKTASSIHLRFDYNETAFRFVFRFDGQPLWKSALTPYKGSNTLSPFVALAAR
ncbi:MAG: phage major capsid protein [Desulfosporosinus sp.]